MTTLLISGTAPMPDGMREVVAKGSTRVEERRAHQVGAEDSLDADRVVFWATREDTDVRALAAACARAERRERREMIVYVTPDGDPGIAGLGENEVFIWPRDEDRLKIAFMTGA